MDDRGGSCEPEAKVDEPPADSDDLPPELPDDLDDYLSGARLMLRERCSKCYPRRNEDLHHMKQNIQHA